MKKVSFSDKITVFSTYNSYEYDRLPSYYFAYLLAYKRINIKEYNEMVDEVNLFKKSEMKCNPESLNNISFLRHREDLLNKRDSV
jgi:hypothetical protein